MPGATLRIAGGSHDGAYAARVKARIREQGLDESVRVRSVEPAG